MEKKKVLNEVTVLDIIKDADKVIQILREDLKNNPFLTEFILYLAWRHVCRSNDAYFDMEMADHTFEQYWKSLPKKEGIDVA